jgi:UPF0176 protein
MPKSDVVSFYRFFDLADPAGLRPELQSVCEARGLLGTVLLASEGINGTLAGAACDIRAVFGWLRETLGFDHDLDGRWTQAAAPPFRRLRVREKKEIVALGRPEIRPQENTGRHVSPAEWNALIANPETVVIDTRNRYEVEVGTFPNAVDPGTDSFRDFVHFAEQMKQDATGVDDDLERPVAMFCTGGIRCEKATALMLELGFRNVSQLDGGILNYLESTDSTTSLWQGECFVFDTRVAVDRDLGEGAYVQCHACRRPLSQDDIRSPDYLEGVSCPKCVAELDDGRAARLKERRKQVQLARDRGEAHIGARLPPPAKS